MSTVKRIICLANSRKLNGRCFAGKELDGKKIGNWIRPVSSGSSGELTTYQMRCQGGHDPRHLEIVKLAVSRPAPNSYQSENWLVDKALRWKVVAKVPDSLFGKINDNPSQLWINGYSSTLGNNDRIPLRIASSKVETSLVLIRPESSSLRVYTQDGRRKVRVHFSYNGTTYSLVCTDPLVEMQSKRVDEGHYDLIGDNHLFTASLTEPFNGYVYKLVAGIIGFEGIRA